VILCLLGVFIVASAGRAQHISEADAQRLVVAAVGEEVSRLPHFGVDPWVDQTIDGFYVFEVTAEYPRGGSPVVGQFAVDKIAGSVWRLGSCNRVESKALTRAQTAIRKRRGISDSELKRAAARRPCEP
jgi:hypothetical protein